MMKPFAFLPALLILGLASEASAAGIEVGGSITATSFSGTIDNNGTLINTTWTVGGSNLSFDTGSFLTDNSYQSFNNAAFTPPTADLDRISTLFAGGALGATGTLDITFDQPVTNPTISFLNVDHTNWEILNPGASLTLLSQNGGLDGGLIGSNIIQDITLNNATAFADSTDIASGSGTIQINGTFTELNFLTTRVSDRPGTTNDGQRFQFLVRDPVVVPPPTPATDVPEPSTVFGSLAVVLGLLGSSYKKRI